VAAVNFSKPLTLTAPAVVLRCKAAACVTLGIEISPVVVTVTAPVNLVDPISNAALAPSISMLVAV